jgi:ubiquinone/menaquinone biosynthesis C-methylase UbiE
MSSASSDILAQLYDDHSELQFEHGLQLIKNHLKPRKGQSILDLGCGTGRLSLELAGQVGNQGKVIGVDPDKERIEVAKKRLFNNNVVSLSFLDGLVYDAAMYGPFDGVYANFVLHWVPQDDIRSTLRCIYKCLKPGGRLVAHMTANTGDFIADLVLMATGKNEESVTGMCMRFLPFWKKHCIDAGFQVQTPSQDFKISVKSKNLPHYLDFVKAYTNGTVDATNINDDDLQDLLRKHQIDDPNHEVHTNAWIVRVVATKPDLDVS